MKTPATEEKYLKKQNKIVAKESWAKNKTQYKKELKEQIRQEQRQKHVSKIIKKATNYFIKQINKTKSGQIIHYKFDKVRIKLIDVFGWYYYTDEDFKPVLDKLKELYPYLHITMKVVDSGFFDDPPEIRIHPLLINKTEYYITTENESNPEKCANKIFFSDSSLEKQKLKQALKIINDKNVNISLLHCCNIVEDYNFEEHERYGDYAIYYELTEEEFSFVKESLSLITKEME